MPRHPTALLLIDVISDMNFPGGELVLPWAQQMAVNLKPVVNRCRRAGVPVIYVNDNFGLWRDDFAGIVRHATRPAARGRAVARDLKPAKSDYFILKPKHSAFFATSLVPLLQHLGVKRLILAGMATNLCVLFTAHDAHMHEYQITVLSDCCAAESDGDHNVALAQLKNFLRVKVCLGKDVKA